MLQKRLSKRVIALAVSTAVVSLGLTACGSSSPAHSGRVSNSAYYRPARPSADSGGSAARSHKIKLRYLIQFGNDYEYASANYAKQTAVAAGGTLSVASANDDPSTQVNQCLDAITAGYTGLLIWSIDGGGMEYCAKRAIAAGIKVVALENPIGPNFTDLKPQVPGVTGSVFMPTSYEGSTEIKLVAKACARKNPCELGYIQGLPTTSYDTSKLAVVHRTLKHYPNIKLVALGTSQFVASGGLSAAQDMLTAHPNLNVIMCDDDDSAHGAYIAVKTAGKTSQIKIIGVGYGTSGRMAIKAGQEYGSVAYLPKDAARTATTMLIHAIRGQSVGNNAVAEQTLIPASKRVVTKANVNDVTPQWGPGIG
jgi:ribose transport system substrate-binding protein